MTRRVSKHGTNQFGEFSLFTILCVSSQVQCLQAYFKRKMLTHAAVTVMPAMVWYFYGKSLVVYGSADGTLYIVNIYKYVRNM